MNAYWLLVAGGFVAQAALFLRWLYRRLRDEEIQRAFVRDLALNHLPHIYSTLARIAHKLGVELEAQPPIRYVEIKNRS